MKKAFEIAVMALVLVILAYAMVFVVPLALAIALLRAILRAKVSVHLRRAGMVGSQWKSSGSR